MRERLCAGIYRVFYRVSPGIGSDATGADVRVLRVYGPGQDRRGVPQSASAVDTPSVEL